MPLSDEEARLLQQLEQSLAEEDPDFASTLRGSKMMARNRRIAIASAVGFVAGIIMLLAGAIWAVTVLGIIGFAVMIGTAYFFLIAWRRGIAGAEETAQAPRGGGGSPPKSSGSFIDRMEDRWNRRREGGS